MQVGLYIFNKDFSCRLQSQISSFHALISFSKQLILAWVLDNFPIRGFRFKTVFIFTAERLTKLTWRRFGEVIFAFHVQKITYVQIHFAGAVFNKLI